MLALGRVRDSFGSISHWDKVKTCSDACLLTSHWGLHILDLNIIYNYIHIYINILIYKYYKQLVVALLAQHSAVSAIFCDLASSSQRSMENLRLCNTPVVR